MLPPLPPPRHDISLIRDAMRHYFDATPMFILSPG